MTFNQKEKMLVINSIRVKIISLDKSLDFETLTSLRSVSRLRLPH